MAYGAAKPTRRHQSGEHIMWDTAELGPFDPNYTDRQKIEDRKAVPCRICENAFRRLRLTLRYCNNPDCNRGYCEGEHGTFAGKISRCVQCGPHA
jgi:hypothetical protein